MPRKGHSEEQIVYAIRQVEAGKKVTDVCREMGVSAQAFYSWKRRYAGIGVSELRELRQLRDENRQLKLAARSRPSPEPFVKSSHLRSLQPLANQLHVPTALSNQIPVGGLAASYYSNGLAG